MNILKNRLANKKNNIYGEEKFKLSFKNGIKSIDVSNIYFNNFF